MDKNREIERNFSLSNDPEKRMRIMFDAVPLCCNLWSQDRINIDCNQEAVSLFGLSNKIEYLERFTELSPLYQPDGCLSSEKSRENVTQAFETGWMRFEWMHQTLDGTPVPAEITLVRVEYEDTYLVAGYTRDLRDIKAAEAEARQAEERMRIMFDAVPLCCNLWNREHMNIDCNQEAVDLFQLSSKKEYLDRFFELSPLYQPDGRPTSEKAQEKVTQAFETGWVRFEWMHQMLNGDPVPSEITLVRVKHENDYVVAGYTRDLRDIKAATSEARAAQERMRIMFDAVPVCCNLWDTEHNNIDCNQEAVDLFELSSKQEYLERFFELSPVYQPDGRLSSEKASEKINEAFKDGIVRFEWMHQMINGDPVPSEITLVRVKHENGYLVAGYTLDLREIKRTVSMLSRMEQLAFTDAVTGISNRHHFMDTAKKAFLNLPPKREISIMMVDVDHFKYVNDTYGHTTGDNILKAIAHEVQGTLRESDYLARYGGEEFIIMVNDSNKNLIVKLAERLRKKIAETRFGSPDETISVTISIGVAIRNNVRQTLEELIELADDALYKAKANGRNRIETA